MPISGPQNELEALLAAADQAIGEIPSAAAVLATSRRLRAAQKDAAQRVGNRPIPPVAPQHPRLRVAGSKKKDDRR
jgi:hypothetical protein